MSSIASALPPASFERVVALVEGRDLAGVTRGDTPSGPALEVAGSVFARLDGPGILALDCPHQQKALLVEISPQIYFDPPGLENEPVLMIRLAEIGDEELSLRLHDAWHFRAPESLRTHRHQTTP